MGYKYYNIEQVMEQLNRRYENAKAAAEAWGKVTIKRKKDGEEYAQVSRAVENAKLKEQYDMLYLSVYYTVNGRYESDDILAYDYIDMLPKDDPRRAGKPLSEGYMRTKYFYTAEELREKVAERIEYWANIADGYANDLSIADEVVSEYRTAIEAAEEKLKARCSTGMFYIATE